MFFLQNTKLFWYIGYTYRTNNLVESLIFFKCRTPSLLQETLLSHCLKELQCQNK